MIAVVELARLAQQLETEGEGILATCDRYFIHEGFDWKLDERRQRRPPPTARQTEFDRRELDRIIRDTARRIAIGIGTANPGILFFHASDAVLAGRGRDSMPPARDITPR